MHTKMTPAVSAPTTMTSAVSAHKSFKRFRIPKRIDVIIDKLKNGKNLTKEQDKSMKKIIKESKRDYEKAKNSFRRILFLLRLQNDCLFLEEGEILS